MNKCAILIPQYQPLRFDEQQTLLGYDRYLNQRELIFVSPEGTPPIRADVSRLTFHHSFFSNTVTYSKLLLSLEFYESVLSYDYILIYQLDCLVFADRLEEFCALGYDYIGAPFFKSDRDPSKGFSRVGNGGFSLRKVSSFLRVLESGRIPPWTAALTEPFLDLEVERTSPPAPPRNGKGGGMTGKIAKRLRIIREARRGVKWYTQNYSLNEDLFWSDRARLFDPTFKVAPVEVGLKFAFERFPRYCYEQNGYQLPFGAHAWAKHDREFWEDILNSR